MFKTKILRLAAAIFAVAFMVAAVAGCDNAADSGDEYGHYEGIVGTWQSRALSKITFKADGTMTAEDIQPFDSSSLSGLKNYKNCWKSEKNGDGYVIWLGKDGDGYANWGEFRNGKVYIGSTELTKVN